MRQISMDLPKVLQMETKLTSLVPLVEVVSAQPFKAIMLMSGKAEAFWP